MLVSIREWWLLALMVCWALGLRMMMSASDPAARAPFLGNRLKAFATEVLVSRTKSDGVTVPALKEQRISAVSGVKLGLRFLLHMTHCKLFCGLLQLQELASSQVMWLQDHCQPVRKMFAQYIAD